MNITIRDIQYKLKYTIRSLFIYEQITGKSFQFDGLMSEYILFFATLIANNPDMELSFDELINECDENPQIFQNYRKWLLKELEKQALFNQDTEEDNSKKKD